MTTTPPSPTKMDTTPLEPPADKSPEKNPIKPTGFPDDVKEVWVYKRHVQTSGKQALAEDTCFILKRNTVDHKMYLSGPPNYNKTLVEGSIAYRDENDCIFMLCNGKHHSMLMFKGCLIACRADQYVFEGVFSCFNSKKEMVMYIGGCELKGNFLKWIITPEPKLLDVTDKGIARNCQHVMGSFRRKFALDLKRDTNVKQGSLQEVMDVGVHAIEQLILYFGKELFEWLKERSKKHPHLKTLLNENVLKAGSNVSLDQLVGAGGCSNVTELLAIQDGKPARPSTPSKKRKRDDDDYDEDGCLKLEVFIRAEHLRQLKDVIPLAFEKGDPDKDKEDNRFDGDNVIGLDEIFGRKGRVN